MRETWRYLPGYISGLVLPGRSPAAGADVSSYDSGTNQNSERTVTPQEKTRQEIDRQLAASSWLVQDQNAMQATLDQLSAIAAELQRQD